VLTQAGEVQVERDYSYGEGCKTGVFPRDAVLGLTGGLYRQGMTQPMVWLSGLLPDAQGGAVFERIGQCRIGASSLWRRVQAYGERMLEVRRHNAAQVSPERVQLAA